MNRKMIDIDEAFEITGGSEELYRQILELFIEISPDQVGKIRGALDRGDYEALRDAAHDLKSSASSFGARILYDSALRVEQSAKKKLDLSALVPMIKDIEENVDLTIEYSRNCRWPVDGQGWK